jgi:hypothetical protein
MNVCQKLLLRYCGLDKGRGINIRHSTKNKNIFFDIDR